MFLIFDTETTGLPRDYNAPITDSENWPRLVQLAWQVHDEKGALVAVHNYIVRPDGFDIPFNAAKVHGITTNRALAEGHDLKKVLEHFQESLRTCTFVVGHNISFDINIVGAEFHRCAVETPLMRIPSLDTKDLSADYCAIPGGKGGKFKWPNLTELHEKLFGSGFDAAHNAAADVEATARCFLELVRLNVIPAQTLGFEENGIHVFRKANPSTIQPIGLNTQPYPPEDLGNPSATSEKKDTAQSGFSTNLKDHAYAHLHNHSQYSILQSTMSIKSMVSKAAKDRMPAIAVTDTGNMMGLFVFAREVRAYNKNLENRQASGDAASDEIPLKPVLGCELFVCKNRLDQSNKDDGFKQVFLAKNQAGYVNLSKLSSSGFIEGFYYVPRIDKDILSQHSEGVIATTGGLSAEIPYLILNVGERQAEDAFIWYHEQFGEDFYVQLQRHGLEEEEHVNQVLLGFCKKYGVKYIAANETFYLNKEDANTHDILLCVRDGEKISTPKGRGRGFRYGLPNDQYYFKTQEEMKQLFRDLPEAISNITEIIEKIEVFDLERDILLPNFEIPEAFQDPQDVLDGGKRGENNYLRHLTYEGAKQRYGEITPEIDERLDFELKTIANTGYPGYFLIVQDFTNKAREMGIWVGPGRGSAAGSAVAYCTGITNVDPIKYDLLFERFLNPDRVSMPDIDIDFDDEGREHIINWVVNKYGSNQVAQIVTYGTMAGKSAIRDAARVLDLPLKDADRLAKLMPDLSLSKLLETDEQTLRKELRSEQVDGALALKRIYQEDSPEGECLRQAAHLEGSIRNTGIHACGVIITPGDIREYIPVAVQGRDAQLWNTQFDNGVVESAGLLKMDFLGLKTLSVIRDAIKLVKENHDKDIDPDTIPLDDVKTYELYQRGETVATFQFESPGMQKYLRLLKPDRFEDLIAMNALYRPGPMDYIPDFIDRKNGVKAIEFDLEGMDEYLAETYGITVYQEQVMLLSQKLAGFTKGEADMLRKAMGKKQKAVIDKMKPKFLEGASERGHDAKICEKIWADWEKFAQYAFNKSHATCYSVVAYQTAYLKANYPAEYMASSLTHVMNNTVKLSLFMEECKRMGIQVLGPDINNSGLGFTPKNGNEVLFGISGMKGVGENAALHIIDERKKNGPFKNLFDFLKRVDLRTINKRTVEALILGGAFDNFPNQHRAVYFHQEPGESTAFLEKAMRYAAQVKANENSAQLSLFGDSSEVDMPEPPLPNVDPWTSMETLRREKEINSIYISGHPLDDFKEEFKQFINTKLAYLNQPEELERRLGRDLSVAGIVSQVRHLESRDGKPFGIFVLEDFSDVYEFRLFGDDYLKFKMYLQNGLMLLIRLKMIKNVYEKNGNKFEMLRTNISSMMLLQDTLGDLTRRLELNINLKGLNKFTLTEVMEIVERHQGKTPLKIHIQDDENHQVTMTPKTKNVEISKSLLRDLRDLEYLHYKLISN
jgi:DNA polymerase-3 subunit alpha